MQQGWKDGDNSGAFIQYIQWASFAKRENSLPLGSSSTLSTAVLQPQHGLEATADITGAGRQLYSSTDSRGPDSQRLAYPLALKASIRAVQLPFLSQLSPKKVFIANMICSARVAGRPLAAAPCNRTPLIAGTRSLVRRGVLEKAREETGDLEELARLEKADAFAELKAMAQSVNRRQKVRISTAPMSFGPKLALCQLPIKAANPIL